MRVHHPLQQGLRQSVNRDVLSIAQCASASSITTRIKTTNYINASYYEVLVRVHHPLQQGLRPMEYMSLHSLVWRVRVHHPLQQGLRQLLELLELLELLVRVHHPLQQGLRPSK